MKQLIVIHTSTRSYAANCILYQHEKNVRLSQVSKTKIAYSYYRNYSSAVEIFRLEKLFINV